MSSLVRIALRNVLRQRRRSAITAAAVVIGIGALVGIRGFMNGLEGAIVANMADGRLGALSVHHPRYLGSEEQAPLTLDLPGDPAFLARIAAVPGVRSVTPRILFSSAVSLGDETGFAQVVAVDPRREYRTLTRARDAIAEGRVLQAPGEALLGVELARALHARLGDTITFLAADRDGVLNAAEAKLVGLLLYKTPGDRRVAALALPDADQLLRMEGRVTELAVSLEGDLEGENLERARAAVQAALGADGAVSTWAELASWLEDMIAFQKLLFAVVGLVFIAVVLTGITNTMLMSVLERVREIGTLMALGVRRRQIVLLFLTESAALGLLGGLAGAMLGSLAVLYLGHRGIDFPPPGMRGVHNLVRPFVTWRYLFLAVGLSTVGAAVSAVYPALKASRLRPVEALQHV